MNFLSLFLGWHSVENASCSEDLCHRCLKQYAKLYKGEIDSISRYCPLDLFSGDETRMKDAIFDLFERPHNRFKIFKNGRMLYTEHTGNAQTLQQELQRWLGPKTNAADAELKDDGKNIHRLSSLLCTALLSPIENDNSHPLDSVSLNKGNDRNKVKATKNNIFFAKKNFDTTSYRPEKLKSFNAHVPHDNSNMINSELGRFH